MEPVDQKLLKRISVLLVEDETEIRDQVALLLNRRVGSLYSAANGQEGLALFTAHRPDVVVTDISMPLMTGLQMAEAIKKLDPEAPVIVITAFNEQDFFLRSIELGIDRYVLKPVDTTVLIDALSKCAHGLLLRREREAAERYVRFVLDMHPGFIITLSGGDLEYVNKTFLDFFRCPTLEAFKRSYPGLDVFTAEGDDPARPGGQDQWLRSVLERPDAGCVVSLREPREPGTAARSFLVTCRPFTELDRFILTFADVSGLEKERRRLRKLVLFDALTGIHNRASLEQTLEVKLRTAHRYEIPLSVILFDIDHFKAVNDTFGHPTGDRVLRTLAGVVSERLRKADVFARWGGEEFMIVLPHTKKERAAYLAEKLRAAIEAMDPVASCGITCSFGVAELREEDNAESLSARADDALYDAKRGGRNRVCSR
jgi:diguanylate cyclase (GGDEF)-like protein